MVDLISVIGGVYITAGLFALMFRRKTFVWVLSASMPFPATAAITIADNSIPPFYILALMATTMALFRWVDGVQVQHRAFVYFSSFTAWALFATFSGPMLFTGIPVLVPRAGIDSQIAAPGTLEFNLSMAAQTLYLILGAGTALYFSQEKQLSPRILVAGFSLGTILSTLRLAVELLGFPWPNEIFQNYGSASYSRTETRFVGIFPEPSYLAIFSVAALVVFVMIIPHVGGAKRAAYLFLTGAALLNTVLASSGTAVLGSLTLVGVLFAHHFKRLLFRQRRIGVLTFLFPLLLAVFVLVGSQVINGVIDVIVAKAGTGSFENRTGADRFSFNLMHSTFGLGVGLGANSSSSFATMLLSCVGIVGFALFAIAIVITVRAANAVELWRPAAWALVALLITKTIADPALSTPSLWLAIGACLYAGRTARSDRMDRRPGLRPALPQPSSKGAARINGSTRGTLTSWPAGSSNDTLRPTERPHHVGSSGLRGS